MLIEYCVCSMQCHMQFECHLVVPSFSLLHFDFSIFWALKHLSCIDSHGVPNFLSPTGSLNMLVKGIILVMRSYCFGCMLDPD